METADPNVSQRAARERNGSGEFMETVLQYDRVKMAESRGGPETGNPEPRLLLNGDQDPCLCLNSGERSHHGRITVGNARHRHIELVKPRFNKTSVSHVRRHA